MNIRDVVGDKVLIVFKNGNRLEGILKAVDDYGFGFETTKKSSYITFDKITQMKTVPLLEEVLF
jgi:ribosome maturation factor RimP